MDILALVLRWTHIFCGATLIGGLVFQRFGLLAAVENLDEPVRIIFGQAWRKVWSRIVMATTGLLIVSGLINFWLVMQQFDAAETEMPSWYHMLFGLKFLLALGVFFIASLLSGRREKSARLRENPKTLLNVGLLLVLLIVVFSGILRSSHASPNPNAPADTPAAVSGEEND
jgi:hypothetical protein